MRREYGGVHFRHQGCATGRRSPTIGRDSAAALGVFGSENNVANPIQAAKLKRAVEKWHWRTGIFNCSSLGRKQFLTNSTLVRAGNNYQVAPSAVIQGPAAIGDNVTIGPGVVTDDSIIGHNADVM